MEVSGSGLFLIASISLEIGPCCQESVALATFDLTPGIHKVVQRGLDESSMCEVPLQTLYRPF